MHVLDQEARDEVFRRPLRLHWTDAEMNSDILSLPGLHTLSAKVIYPVDGEDDFDEILPFLLTPPGLKHLNIEMEGNLPLTGPDADQIPMASLKGKWQEIQDMCPPKQRSRLESLTISGNGPPPGLKP